MVELFYNVIDWFVIHKNEVQIALTSGNVAAFISAIWVVVKQLKVNKDTSAIVSSLITPLKTSIESATVISELKTKIDNIEETVATLQNESNDKFDKLLVKINAILDVQSIVYSTVKDESIRDSINGILISAKHAETTVLSDIEKDLEHLKEQLDKKVDAVKEVVEHTAVKVKKTASSTKNPTVSRY